MPNDLIIEASCRRQLAESAESCPMSQTLMEAVTSIGLL